MTTQRKQKQMKISATSALVSNWTDHKLWQSPETLAYCMQLDLSEGEPLLSYSVKKKHLCRIMIEYFNNNQTNLKKCLSIMTGTIN